MFWRLGFPALAGLYWYSLDAENSDMESALRAFETSCGNNPALIVYALNSARRSEEAEAHPRFVEAMRRERELSSRIKETRGTRLRDRLALFGCASIFVFTFMMFMFGLAVFGMEVMSLIRDFRGN